MIENVPLTLTFHYLIHNTNKFPLNFGQINDAMTDTAVFITKQTADTDLHSRLKSTW